MGLRFAFVNQLTHGYSLMRKLLLTITLLSLTACSGTIHFGKDDRYDAVVQQLQQQAQVINNQAKIIQQMRSKDGLQGKEERR
jgi:hypothetical protein